MVQQTPTRCEHLRILNHERTECAVWRDRVAGMPVQLVDVMGVLVQMSNCALPDYPQGLPDNYPLPGPCSYRWKVDRLSRNLRSIANP